MIIINHNDNNNDKQTKDSHMDSKSDARQHGELTSQQMRRRRAFQAFSVPGAEQIVVGRALGSYVQQQLLEI